MKYEECMKIIIYLNNRMQKLTPWYKWSVKITWEKLLKWYNFLREGEK